MSLSNIQLAAPITPSQSPVAFSILSPSYTGSAYQYTADVYVWSGSYSNSGSALWTVRKYPNQNGYGIFDFSRILTTKLQDLAVQNTSNVYFYKILFGEQWYSASLEGNVIITGSIFEATENAGQKFRVIDGYDTFPTPVDYGVYNSPSWPWMSDMTQVTQSVTNEDFGTIGLYVGDYPGKVDDKSIVFTGLYEDNSTATVTVAASGFPSATTQEQIKQVQIYPGGDVNGADPFASGFPLSIIGLKSYSVALTGTGMSGAQAFQVEVVCKPKWDGYQVQWKNKYGQFDHLNMMNVSKTSFKTDQRVYQPQLGSWNAPALGYNQYSARTQRYIVDSSEQLLLNTAYLDEAWNDLLRGLFVADEIYYRDTKANEWRPITIDSNQIDFKTGVNDKLVQYSILFTLGQPYKLQF